MRSTALILVALMAAGCEPTPPRGPFEPAKVANPDATTAPAPARARASAGAGASASAAGGAAGFDFEAEDRKDEEDGAEVDVDPLKLQAEIMGLDPDALSTPEPKPAPGSRAPVGPAMVMPMLPSPQWDPNQPIDGGWGIRVVATLHDVQPPRAVVAMPDGQELVVQAGQMLPNYRLVVLAVGHDAVQVARITPQGFYAKVETETVASLAPSARP